MVEKPIKTTLSSSGLTICSQNIPSNTQINPSFLVVGDRLVGPTSENSKLPPPQKKSQLGPSWPQPDPQQPTSRDHQPNHQPNCDGNYRPEVGGNETWAGGSAGEVGSRRLLLCLTQCSGDAALQSVALEGQAAVSLCTGQDRRGGGGGAYDCTVKSRHKE